MPDYSAEPNTDDAAALIAAKVAALMVGYSRRYDDSDYEVVEVEKTILTPVVNPDTGRESRTWLAAGKLDVVAMQHSRVFPDRDRKSVIIDHKSTSEAIDEPGGTYWQHLAVAAQPAHYLLLKWIAGEKIDQAMWDVIRRPTIAPRQLRSKAERALISSNRSYYDQPLTDLTLEHLQTSDRENLQMYAARLIDDCTNTRPAWYFQRKIVPRIDSELLDYGRELWEAGKIIAEARRLNRWPKHSGSCMTYGSPCPYLGICSGYDKSDSDKWVRKEQVHAELPELDGDGKNVLTFSSIRCFQVCPKKYHFTYEMGIERADAEDREVLRFGQLLHTALETYWNALKPRENTNGGNNTGDSVSAIDTDTTAVPF